jgi:serine/threonine protein phosphatase PrpC
MKEADADQAMEGMGTTLVAAVNDHELFIASVGDSALTCSRTKLNRSAIQTWVNEVGRRLGPGRNAENSSMRHVLTMAIGVSGNCG